jgi:hypothetical protein
VSTVRLDQVTGAAVLVALGLMAANVLVGLGNLLQLGDEGLAPLEDAEQ